MDSSAIIAVLCRETGHEAVLRKIGKASILVIGAPTLAETQSALTIKLKRDASALVEQFIAEIEAVVIPFGREHVSAFFTAFTIYGKGRHPARLNMGDCFTYATARVANLPVLFVGEDFSQTDIACA